MTDKKRSQIPKVSTAVAIIVVLVLSLTTLIAASMLIEKNKSLDKSEKEVTVLESENLKLETIIASTEVPAEEIETQKPVCTQDDVVSYLSSQDYINLKRDKFFQVNTIETDSCTVDFGNYVEEYLFEVEGFVTEYQILDSEKATFVIIFLERIDESSIANIENQSSISIVNLRDSSVSTVYSYKGLEEVTSLNLMKDHGINALTFRIQDITGVGCGLAGSDNCNLYDQYRANVCKNGKHGVYYLDLETEKVQKVAASNLLCNK